MHNDLVFWNWDDWITFIKGIGRWPCRPALSQNEHDWPTSHRLQAQGRQLWRHLKIHREPPGSGWHLQCWRRQRRDLQSASGKRDSRRCQIYRPQSYGRNPSLSDCGQHGLHRAAELAVEVMIAVLELRPPEFPVLPTKCITRTNILGMTLARRWRVARP